MRKVKKKIAAFGFVHLLLLFPALCQSSFAQADSSFYHVDSVSTNESSGNDSARTYDGYDTTGYFFNWKQYPDDPYTTEKINVRISSDSSVRRLKNDDDFWYVKSIESFKKNAVRLQYDRKYRDSLTKVGLLPSDEVFKEEQNDNKWYYSVWFIRMIWLVIISIFIAAIVYFLLSNKISLFSKNAAKTNSEDATIEDVFNLHYEPLLKKYIAEKNYRFAVRVLYLQLLKLLNERSLIAYQPQFTNAQYLQQLQSSPLYRNFFIVTKHYEYIWYGEFNVSENVFQKVRNDFVNLTNQATHS